MGTECLVMRAGWVLTMAMVVAPRPGDHPMHTTFTEIIQPATGRPVTMTVRGFEDDLTHAARRVTPGGSADSAIARYLDRNTVLTDARGRKVVLRLRGIRRSADVVWLTFQSAASVDLRGTRFLNQALTELFHDQVNIVQVKTGSRSRTLMFTAGERAKPIG